MVLQVQHRLDGLSLEGVLRILLLLSVIEWDDLVLRIDHIRVVDVLSLLIQESTVGIDAPRVILGIRVGTIGKVGASVGLIEEEAQTRGERLDGAEVNVGGEVVPVEGGALGGAVLRIVSCRQVVPRLVGSAA